jgi:hypothetical protein
MNKIKSMSYRIIAVLVLFSFLATQSACSRITKSQLPEYGFQQAPVEIKEGIRVWPVDVLGNFFGILYKIIIFNWKIKRHKITEPTEKAINEYLTEHGEELGNLKIQLNRYAPQDAWKRLVKNKRVKWPYRLFFGTFVVLIFDTLLIDRIFGGDRYNPYTHQVHIHSDLPSVALHELGHAYDFSYRRYKGSYALFRIVPFVDLYQEYQATDSAFDYMAENRKEKKLYKTEIESYNVLYPAFSTYVGRYLGFGAPVAWIAGHVWGRSESSAYKKRHAKEISLLETA